MKLYLKLFIFSFVFTFSTGSHAYENSSEAVGYVSSVDGQVSVTRKVKSDASSRQAQTKQTVVEILKEEDLVYVGDFIKTDTGENITLTFQDESVIQIGGKDGFFRIDEYSFSADKPKENKAEYSFLRSNFKYISGLISKSKKEQETNTILHTEYGSMGIRGTTLYRALRSDGESWVFLEEGKIDVYNQSGNVTLNPGEGTRLFSTKKAPREPEIWTQKQVDWIKARFKQTY